MAVFDWPSEIQPQTMVLRLQKSGVIFRSPFNGTAQAVDFVAERWAISLTLPMRRRINAGGVEALILGLAGGVDQARCWHFARPIPTGTMRGNPVLAAQSSRGDKTLSITTTAGATLRKGDMIGVGSHLLMVAADAVADGVGAMSVSIVNRIRSTLAIGSAVSWDAPKAAFASLAQANATAYIPAWMESAAIDLEEVY